MKLNRPTEIIILLVVILGVIKFYFFVTEPIQAQAQLQVQQPGALSQVRQEAPHIGDEKEAAKIPSEAQQTFEEKHKDKDVIFLLNELVIEINEDWSYAKKVHKRIKILKENAKYMGEIPVPYEKGREKITDIKAHTITPDGEKHRYSKIQDFRMRKGYRMYSDYRYKIITMPEVNVGSIIEYSSTIMSKGKPIKDAFWYYTDFGSNTPIKEHRFIITFPKSLGIKYKGFNVGQEPEITETDSTITYAWRIQDIGDYDKGVSESFLPPPRLEDVRDFIEFSSIDSWKDISDWYYLLVEKNLKINHSIEKAMGKVLKGHINTKDKVRAVLEYIQENFRYVSMSFGDNTLEPHPTDQVFRNKYGDCKDLSLLCMAMLKLGGIKSHIALFNNEFSLTAPEHDLPFPSLFNHVLLLVEDPEEGNFYIDPLLEGYDIGQYPFKYQRAYTFIITENGGKFDRSPIFDEKRDYSRKERTITIEPDGGPALLEAKSLWDLDVSIKTRKFINSLDEKEKEKAFQIIDSDYEEILERKWDGLEQKYGPINSYIKARMKDGYPITDDMIIIDIAGYVRNSDFTEKKRKNPVFYPANSLTEDIMTYRIPQGFRISYVPKKLNLDIGFFSFSRQYEKKENEIIVTEIMRNKRMERPASDYSKIKTFFNELPQKTNQRIVLKKIKPWWQEIKDIIIRFKWKNLRR